MPPAEAKLFAAQQAIGSFLRATRTAQKLTQEQVASMTRSTPWHLSRAAISAIERGQNFPGMEAMLALSNVLYVDPKELVERARLSSVVPVDISEISYEELDRKASGYFWAGDFHRAISVYDAMLEKAALEPDQDPVERSRRIATLEVRRADRLLNVTPIGLKLLLTLMRASPKVVSRRDLERAVWGDIAPDSDALRSHLYTLRKAIDKPFPRPLLQTVPGLGYRLADIDER